MNSGNNKYKWTVAITMDATQHILEKKRIGENINTETLNGFYLLSDFGDAPDEHFSGYDSDIKFKDEHVNNDLKFKYLLDDFAFKQLSTLIIRTRFAEIEYAKAVTCKVDLDYLYFLVQKCNSVFNVDLMDQFNQFKNEFASFLDEQMNDNLLQEHTEKLSIK